MEKQRTRHIRIIKKEGERQRGGKTLVVGSQRKVLAPWEVGDGMPPKKWGDGIPPGRWSDGMPPGSRTEEFVKLKS